MLTVYMTGVIYFNGCDEDVKRMYAPDGTTFDPPHYASLIIAAADVDESATSWWPESRWPIDEIDAIEFRIPEPATLWFPDLVTTQGCHDLEDGLSKVKKKQGSQEEDFEVDPDTAQTIATVTIRGGVLYARKYSEISLVEWAIDTPPTRQITAVLTRTGEPRTISVRNPATIVVSNKYAARAKPPKDPIALYRKLNPAAGDLILVADAPRKNADRVAANAILDHIRPIIRGEGNTPGCCLLRQHA